MPDREKVIEGLYWVINDIEENGHYQIEYYAEEIRNAIALLKELEAERLEFIETVARLTAENVTLKGQEAVKPKAIRTNAFGHPVYACGKCGLLITESMNYCHECGKRIDWEGR